MKKAKGAISLFLIIIVLASTAFGGVFIDMSRVLVAQARVNTATESAVRSTLAGYSTNLVSEWGLFGLQGGMIGYENDDAKKTFLKYLKNNLETSNTEDKGNLIKYEIVTEAVSVELQKPLSDNNVFSEKINEYSKYRAPVSLTMGVVEKFKAVFGKDNQVKELNVTETIDGMIGGMQEKFGNVKKISTNFNSQVDSAGVTRTDGESGRLNTVNEKNLDYLQTNINSDIDKSKGYVDEYESSLKEYKKAGDTGNQQANSVKDNASVTKTNEYINDGSNEELEKLGKNEDKTYSKAGAEQGTDGFDASAEGKNLDNTISKTEQVSGENTEKFKKDVDAKIKEAKALLQQYNEAAGSYNIKVSTLGDSGVSSTTVMKYAGDTLSEFRSNLEKAKEYVKRVDKEIQDLQKVISTTPPTQSEIDAASAKEKETRAQNEKFWENVMSKYDDTVEGHETEILREICTNSEYSTIKDFYSEYMSKDENKDKSLSDVLKDYSNSINEQSKKVGEMKKNLNSYKSSVKKSATALAKKEDKQYKAYYYIVNHSSSVEEAVKKKEEANNLYSSYNSKLEEIKAMNTQDGIKSNTIEDFATETDNKVKEVENSTFSEKFQDLLDFADKLDEFAKQMNKTLPKNDPQDSDLDKGSGIISFFNNVKDYFVGLGEIVTNKDGKLIDKFYLVDYIMNKCTFVTSQTSRNHFFKYGEAEYVIFGHENQLENIKDAVKSITFMRLSINIVNYWLTSVNPEPISRTVEAVLKGLGRTLEDMTTMLFDTGTGSDKGFIAICPSLSQYKVLSYSDHLRLLLLLKVKDDGGAGALRRCIYATMKDCYSEGNSDVSTDKPLNEYYTQMKATASVDVKLFFIPMFFPEKVNFGSIHDGKYRVTSTVTFGY